MTGQAGSCTRSRVNARLAKRALAEKAIGELRADDPFDHALETTSPRERAVLVRERARRTVRLEEREAHGLTCGLLDGARALEVVEARRGEARARSVDLDACRLEFQGEGERDRVEGSLRRAVTDAEHRAMRIGRLRVHRQRPGGARYVDDASRRRFTKEWQHRLRDGDDAKHVRLEHRAHLLERRDARAARLHDLLERPARLSRMRDGRVVHQDVETAELVPDALCRGGDGGPIRDVELERASIRSDALRGRLPRPEVARPDEHGEAVRREILGDLKTDSFVGPGNQGDGFVLHGSMPHSCDVFVDTTGVMYLTDTNAGLYILQYEGS